MKRKLSICNKKSSISEFEIELFCYYYTKIKCEFRRIQNSTKNYSPNMSKKQE